MVRNRGAAGEIPRNCTVVPFRRKMIRLAEAVDRGEIGAAAIAPELYNIRSVSVLVRSDERLADVLTTLERGDSQ